MWDLGRSRGLIFRLVTVAAIGWFVLYGPSPMAKPFLHKTVQRHSQSTGVWEDTFSIDRSIPQLHVHTFSKVAGAGLSVDLDAEGGTSLLKDFPIIDGHASFSCGRELPPGQYLLRVHETNVIGNYLIEMGARSAVTWWQRLLLVLVSLAVVGAALCLPGLFRRTAGPTSPAFQVGRTILMWVAIVLFANFFYLLLHEGGHALASICFGNFDWSRTDLLGLTGAPHSGIRPEVELEPWQQAVQSIIGPLLPIFVGWVLFVAWWSAPGKRICTMRAVFDGFFSFSLLVLLVSSLGLFISLTGLRRDSDYAGFIDNVPVASWAANTILLLIGVISVAMLVPVVGHLIQSSRSRSKRLILPDNQ